VLAHELEKQFELRAIDRLGYIRPAHVVDDDGGRQRREEIQSSGRSTASK